MSCTSKPLGVCTKSLAASAAGGCAASTAGARHAAAATPASPASACRRGYAASSLLLLLHTIKQGCWRGEPLLRRAEVKGCARRLAAARDVMIQCSQGRCGGGNTRS